MFLFYSYMCTHTHTQNTNTQDSMLTKAESVESITTDLDEIHGELYLGNARIIMHK